MNIAEAIELGAAAPVLPAARIAGAVIAEPSGRLTIAAGTET